MSDLPEGPDMADEDAYERPSRPANDAELAVWEAAHCGGVDLSDDVVRAIIDAVQPHLAHLYTTPAIQAALAERSMHHPACTGYVVADRIANGIRGNDLRESPTCLCRAAAGGEPPWLS